MIEIKKKNSLEFVVIVSEDGTRTEHIVTLDDVYYENLTQGKITKEELIKRSFEFLLKRESKESILSKFNLKIIKNYFPAFEREIIAKDISEEDVHRAVGQVMHPAIDRTLVDLGIVKDVAVRDNKVTVTLALPFPQIPIKDYLINSVRESITKLGLEVEVNLTVMSQQERESFLAMEQDSWKGI